MTKRNNLARTTPKTKTGELRLPFIEHLLELRRRLFYVAVSVVIWAGAAYGVEHAIVGWLLRPAHGEKFIYTSVGGGINFLFQICLYVGLAMSLPVMVYQGLRYVEPLIGRHASRFILLSSAVSGLLAVAGMAFGYFLGLPAALQFLLHQFHTKDISALITIQSYMSFVLIYLFGSSLMFQVPLMLFIVNRFKRLKLRMLFKYERWVIVVSLVAAALINPSPRLSDLSIIAVPMILSYQVGILLVWRANRRLSPQQLAELRRRDEATRAERQERLRTVEYVWEQSELAMSLAPMPQPVAPARPVNEAEISLPRPRPSHPAKLATPPANRSKYVDGFVDLHQPRRRHTV